MRASRLIRAVLFPPLRKYTMKTTKRLYGANTVLYTSVTVMCPVPFPRLCFLLQCSVKLAACFGFGLVILQSSHGWNFFLLSHTVKYFLPLVCRYLLRRFEKCRFYFFGSLLCPSVLKIPNLSLSSCKLFIVRLCSDMVFEILSISFACLS